MRATSSGRAAVARVAHNHQVAGSIPALATKADKTAFTKPMIKYATNGPGDDDEIVSDESADAVDVETSDVDDTYEG